MKSGKQNTCNSNRVFKFAVSNLPFMSRRVQICLSCLLVLISCGQRNRLQSRIPPVKVEVLVVENVSAAPDRLYSGTIAEEESVALSFTGGGTVTEVNIHDGVFVREGQIIAAVDSILPASQLRAAQARLSQARDIYSRMKGMYESGSLPEVQWVEAQSQLAEAQAQERMARKSLEDTRLTAPFNAYVSGCDIRAGQNIGPGIPVTKLLRIDRVKAKFTVPESEAGLFRMGQEVSVLVASAGNRNYAGRIVATGVEADNMTHSFEITALLDNPSRLVLPGMFCQISASVEETDRIVVPSHAVGLNSDNSFSVWLVSGGKAVRRSVSVSGEDRRGVWIASGLAAGDSLIVKGQQKVSEGSSVTLQ